LAPALLLRVADPTFLEFKVLHHILELQSLQLVVEEEDLLLEVLVLALLVVRVVVDLDLVDLVEMELRDKDMQVEQVVLVLGLHLLVEGAPEVLVVMGMVLGPMDQVVQMHQLLLPVLVV
jgi:hypothetical protein